MTVRSLYLLQPGLILASRLLRICLCRSLHTNPLDQVAVKAFTTTKDSSLPRPPVLLPQCKPSNAPLSLLPLGSLFRSYLITSLSSSPRLLTPSLRLLSIVANSSSPFLSPDKNPFLRYALRKTLYAQFCAGENSDEVREKIRDLKALGYSGVILGHGREIVKHDEILKADRAEVDLTPQEDVEDWKRSNLETVSLVDKGGFAALKLTGAGPLAIQHLARRAPPSEQIEKAFVEICDLAKGKGVSILIDAEHHSLQAGIDNWSLRLQKLFNNKGSKAIIYGTYQAYLCSTPTTLSEHLSLADREGFVLGVKLVRGAYMGSDPRHLFWSSKVKTDKAYDGIASALLHGEYNDILKSPGPSAQVHLLPPVNLLLATHNHASVLKALKIQADLLKSGRDQDHIIELSYGQLMGMADEIGCELIIAGRASGRMGPKAYKYLPWGSVGECMKYLVRRGEENRDALGRTIEGRRALGGEIWRRLRG